MFYFYDTDTQTYLHILHNVFETHVSTFNSHGERLYRWTSNKTSPNYHTRHSMPRAWVKSVGVWGVHNQGLHSLNGWTSYHKILQSLEAARFSSDFSNRSEIWKAHRQHCCRDTCKVLEWYDHYNTQSRYFETSRNLAVRRLTAWWIEALIRVLHFSLPFHTYIMQ